MFSGANRREKGVVAVETALGMFFFLVTIALLMELNYLGYVSAVVDYAVAEASRSARQHPYTDYKKMFSRLLADDSALWARFVDTNLLSVSTYYHHELDELLTDDCRADEPHCHGKSRATGNAIAIYQVSYPYKPLFARLTFPPGSAPVIKREVIAVQEYERDGM